MEVSMRRPAIAFVAFLCLVTLGAHVLADPPNRVPLPPPSALITIADHLSIQPGQVVTLPVDVSGWQYFTIFGDAVLPPPEGTPEDSNRCVSDYSLNGLGDNLVQPPLSNFGGGACVSNDPQRWLESGALIGPKFVLTIQATPNLGTAATVTLLMYLH
jgi:hypothetical protein